MTDAALFLDRDGTLIVDKHYLNDVQKIEYLPGVFESLRQLKSLSFRLIVVTNQSGLARGLITEAQLNEIHQAIELEFQSKGVPLDAIYYSAHGPDSNHPMRKPNPGMLELGAKEWNLDLKKCWMIGDSNADIEAGQRAGTKTLWLTLAANKPLTNVSPTSQCNTWTEVVSVIQSHLKTVN
jgi:D,D-heptose 1,7-bisphosphate phosphatase